MSKQQTPEVKLRRDYQPPVYRVQTLDLRFELEDSDTKVHATMQVRREAGAAADAPLVLEGEDLTLLRVAVNGEERGSDGYQVDEETLTLRELPEAFELQTTVQIDPKANTKLEGLYLSNGNFCTQCEAMGFRRITYFQDRPDVMAKYTTEIVADKAKYPVLLSNGNRVGEGDLEDGRHWVKWEDPFPKPSYLFALVAGDLHCHAGTFTTRSGKEVRLEILVEHRNADKCEHALWSLQESMRWDEQVFGLEYDLDIYMIVAVDDFNMGAMENKGLNVFNSKYVLARPDTATDTDYEGILGVIGHEYFHNWTGNRVTCRDWFQLTLKEGLTVFRDQQFSRDMTSEAVKRIQDVLGLRGRQFAEDAGPMAHPIRPESYISMDNFYTATVYQKGAEVIRMYHTLLGPEGFRKGMDLYFERHDGQAVTCDDFRAAMADANQADLEQFGRWYSQAGTPWVEAQCAYDAANKTFTVTLRQGYPDDAQREDNPTLPLHMPVAVGLLGPDGADLPLQLEGEDAPGATTRVLELREAEQSFVFVGVEQEPKASLLRDFSAPVRLRYPRGLDELAFLFAHDADPFNRWEAGQELSKQVLHGLTADVQAGRSLSLPSQLVDSFRNVLADDRLDGSLKALALRLPDEANLAQDMAVVDPDALHQARQFARRELATALRDDLQRAYDALDDGSAYVADQPSIHKRRLKNCALSYLSTLGEEPTTAQAFKQFQSADNMTDAQAALVCLSDLDAPQRAQALDAFYAKWKDDPLVLDKWFSVQAMSSLPDTLERVQALIAHDDFKWTTPNRVRALIAAFVIGNPTQFHRQDGAGYTFLGDAVIKLDAINPQVAARLAGGFNAWRRYDDARQAAMKSQLERIAQTDDLSKNTREIVGRALA